MSPSVVIATFRHWIRRRPTSVLRLSLCLLPLLPSLHNHVRLLFIRTLHLRFSTLDMPCALDYQDLYSTRK